MIHLMDHDLKLPRGHTLVPTQDGTYTFFSEAFQEACHSTSGAKAETILHYFNGCKIAERMNQGDPFVILEVGFGLGVGFLTTLELLPKNKRVHFLSMEIDQNLLEWFKDQNPELGLRWEDNLLRGKIGAVELTVIHGDARKELPRYLQKFPTAWNAVYQDAFSPKKNPSLWTKEWFELLKAHSHPGVILSTYSASSSIRKGLYETGWSLQKGEKFGPKRTSTRATLNTESDAEILLQLERSPVSAFTDQNIGLLK